MGAPLNTSVPMTPREVELVQRTFTQCSSLDVVNRLYLHFFEFSPNSRALFRDVGAQARPMAETILVMARSIGDMPSLEPMFERLGKRHAQVAVISEMFAPLGAALIAALKDVLGQNFDAEMEAAWTHAYALLANRLKRRIWENRESRPRAASRSSYVEQFLKPDRLVLPKVDIQEARDTVASFEGEAELQVPRTSTLLAASLAHGIPHAHECGGQARCSTCRVRVVKGQENCLPRTPAEVVVANQMHFTEDIRLACQLRLKGPVTVRRLLLDSDDVYSVLTRSTHMVGRSMNISVLFCDIRNFTPFVESTLPYDVVHILNRYFNAVTEAVHPHGGYVDKYLGDGVMILFGLDASRETHPAIEAVHAAFEIQRAIAKQNVYFEAHFKTRFTSGIGIAYGPAIVGEVGSWRNSQVTALGDIVNVASRIENLTKDLAVPVLVDEEVAQIIEADAAARVRFGVGERFEKQLKGKMGNRIVAELHEGPSLLST